MSVTVKMKVNMDFSVILVCVIMQNKVPDRFLVGVLLSEN